MDRGGEGREAWQQVLSQQELMSNPGVVTFGVIVQEYS